MARLFSISIRSEYNLAKSISLSFSSLFVYGKMSCDCRESCRNLNFKRIFIQLICVSINKIYGIKMQTLINVH